MKSLIKRVITQSGIEPLASVAVKVSAVGSTHMMLTENYYTESQVYEIAEKVAKAWHKEQELWREYGGDK